MFSTLWLKWAILGTSLPKWNAGAPWWNTTVINSKILWEKKKLNIRRHGPIQCILYHCWKLFSSLDIPPLLQQSSSLDNLRQSLGTLERHLCLVGHTQYVQIIQPCKISILRHYHQKPSKLIIIRTKARLVLIQNLFLLSIYYAIWSILWEILI